MEQQAFREREVCKLLSIGSSKYWELIREGRLRSIRIGTARLVTKGALEDFIRQLEAEAEAAA